MSLYFLCSHSTRYLAFLPLFASIAAPAHAQDLVRSAPSGARLCLSRVAYLRASLGTTYTLGYEYRVARLGLEYAPMLTKHFGLAGRLAGVAGRPTAATPLYGSWIEAVPHQNYRAGFVEVEGLYYPFGITHRVRFAVGLGGFAGGYQLNTISSATIISEQVQGYTLATQQGAATGYLGSLNVEVALGKQRVWLLGVKATRQQGLGASLIDLRRGIANLPGQSLTLARQL